MGLDREQWLGVFESVANSSLDAVMVARSTADDETIRIQFVNRAFTRMTGYDMSSLLGREPTMLFGAATDEAALDAFRSPRAETEGVVALITLYRHDGSTFAAEVSYLQQSGIEGTTWYVATLRDVSALTKAEEALSRSEDWARAIISSITDLILVTDRESMITWTSPSITTRLGYEPSDVIGTSVLDLIHPDQAQLAITEFGDILAGGTSLDPSLYRIRHKDGSWRSLSANASDLTDHPAIQGVVISAADVTDRANAEHLLAEQAEILESIARGAPLEITLQRITQMVEHVVDGASCAIGMLDPDGSIRVRAAPHLSPQIVSFLDALDPDTGAGKSLRLSDGEALVFDFTVDGFGRAGDLFRDAGFVLCRAAAVLAPGSRELLGAIEVFHTSTAPLTRVESDGLDRALNLSAIAIERRRLESTLEYQALYDPLTGLPNRALLLRRTEDALTRSQRLDTGVAVLFIDLDRFKVINDAVGHARGDAVLIEVSERFRSMLRPGDTMARFGGDEFTVVCTRIANESVATAAAAQFLAILAEPIKSDGGDIFVTASIGVSFVDDSSVDAESLVRTADVAMYRAKDQGRNQVVAFQENLDLRAVEKLALEQALRQGIANEEFELYYQPVVRLEDGAMNSVEALVRWPRPDHGMVFPDQFIPLAEETGLIVPLGWWILGEACRHAAGWPVLPNGELVEVAVNLSARQLLSNELEPTLRRVLDETGLDPHRLCFEVTESALIRDVERAKAALMAMKAIGVRLAIDDFGTGYASLDYVRQFSMADYLKIDRSFVEGVENEGSQEEAIVTAAIALARSMGLTVIAEGVETLEQMDALRSMSCEYAQGYLFSRPVPLDAAVALMTADRH